MKLSPRETVLVELLERFNELCDPMQSGNGEGDTGLRLMPATYSASVRELERLLTRMREVRRSQWWHVTERYIRATSVLRDVQVKRKGKNGKTVTLTERHVVAVYDRGVRLEKVRRGVEWLASEWSLPHEPMLPDAILAASRVDDQKAKVAA